jgi:hypothetical protein
VPGTSKTVRIACARTMALLMSCALAAQDAQLHIKVVYGEGTAHAAGAHAAKPLTVQVTDALGHPVEGARVSFQVPENGPGGVFATGLRTDLVTTDSSGRAAVRSLQLNRVTGSFSIRITAAKEEARAGMVVKQSIGDAASDPQPVAAKNCPAGAESPAKPAAAGECPNGCDVSAKGRDGIPKQDAAGATDFTTDVIAIYACTRADHRHHTKRWQADGGVGRG